MTTLTRFITSPSRLAWWEWGKLLGAACIVALGLALAAGHVSPVAVALAAHVACDFTLQSAETARRKGERGRHLAVHALAAGGLPMALAAIQLGSGQGLAARNPVAVLAWALAGAAMHYLVDWTRKFGVRSTALGAFLDQAAHLAGILAVAGGIL